MLTSGIHKRMLTGGWILAALLLLGYNGLELSTVLEPPALGYSGTLKIVREKWEKLNSISPSSNDQPRDVTGLDMKLAKFIPGVSGLKRDAESLAVNYDAKEESRQDAIEEMQIVPPGVSGIIQVTDVYGETEFLAMIEGERLGENDRVNGFTVSKVSSEGVTFSKGGREWFVSIPHSGFSITQTVPSGVRSGKSSPLPAAEEPDGGIGIK